MKLKYLLLCALFAALTAVGTFFRFPLGITYITLQTFISALAGLILGPKYGALSQLVYLLIGLSGLPVFTSGGGPNCVLTPSFGFLIGLIPCAFVTGKAAGHNPGALRTAAACLSGYAVLYAFGLPYMYFILNFYLGKALNLAYVLKYGMLVYLPGDFLKVAVLTAVSRRLMALLNLRH